MRGSSLNPRSQHGWPGHVRKYESRNICYVVNVARTILRGKGQLTLPSAARRALRLEEGDPIEVEIVEDGILLRPQKLIDASQAWYWTPEWQAGEREADEDIAAGRTEFFESGEAFLEALRQRSK